MPADIEVIEGVWQVVYALDGGDPWWERAVDRRGVAVPSAFDADALKRLLPALVSEQRLSPDYVWLPGPGVGPEDRAYHVPTSGVGRFTKTEYQNVIRTYDGKFLGKVGPGFEVIPPAEVVGSIAAACMGEGVQLETAGLLKDGRSGFFLARDPGAGFALRRSDGGEDRSEAYVLFRLAFDGTGALTVCRTSVRVVCANTEAVALARAKGRYKVRHTRNWRERVPELVAGIQGSRKAARVFAASAEALDAARIDRPGYAAVLDDILGIQERRREVSMERAGIVADLLGAEERRGREVLAEATDRAQRARERKRDAILALFERGRGNRGETCWDAFCAATEYEDHHARVRGADNAEVRRRVNALDPRDGSLKQRVYDRLIQRASA